MPYAAILVTWCAMLVVAVVSGGLREKHLAPKLGTHRAKLVATPLACLIFFGIILCFVTFTGMRDAGELWATGFVWLVLTVAFEFLFGRYVLKESWENLLADYNIFKGRLWLVVLLTVLAGPYVAAKIM